MSPVSFILEQFLSVSWHERFWRVYTIYFVDRSSYFHIRFRLSILERTATGVLAHPGAHGLALSHYYWCWFGSVGLGCIHQVFPWWVAVFLLVMNRSFVELILWTYVNIPFLIKFLPTSVNFHPWLFLNLKTYPSSWLVIFLCHRSAVTLFDLLRNYFQWFYRSQLL